jgi:hypothetical protein
MSVDHIDFIAILAAIASSLDSHLPIRVTSAHVRAIIHIPGLNSHRAQSTYHVPATSQADERTQEDEPIQDRIDSDQVKQHLRITYFLAIVTRQRGARGVTYAISNDRSLPVFEVHSLPRQV